ncbi:nuclear transport factor 2 family protein [Bauldia sp.]|uniref:nuclear transport factor 2 family protein n=1 Tax=Bauldia sp. TaxID=2575872 RepID=UPI003BA8CCE6
MSDVHPNVALIQRLDPRNMAAATDVFAEDVVFHYFNPRLPDMEGDYVGLAGIGRFFQTLATMSSGTFRVEPVAVTPVGDELVVVQTRNSLTMDDEDITIDVVVVWRIVDGRVKEVWDIPSAYTAAG